MAGDTVFHSRIITFFLTLFDERINRSMILEGEINKNINKREELTNWRFYSTDI